MCFGTFRSQVTVLASSHSPPSAYSTSFHHRSPRIPDRLRNLKSGSLAHELPATLNQVTRGCGPKTCFLAAGDLSYQILHLGVFPFN